jgi:hypothetical protein
MRSPAVLAQALCAFEPTLFNAVNVRAGGYAAGSWIGARACCWCDRRVTAVLNPRYVDDPEEWLKAATPDKGLVVETLAGVALRRPNHRLCRPEARCIRQSQTRPALRTK